LKDHDAHWHAVDTRKMITNQLFAFSLDWDTIEGKVDCRAPTGTSSDHFESPDLWQPFVGVTESVLKKPFEQVRLFLRERTIDWSYAFALFFCHYLSLRQLQHVRN
jgi:hypothetical protein